jgi:uncharacterized membrane protein YedE/YeeE
MTLGGLSIPLWRSVAGGALIGAAAAVLILSNGRIAGVSGILDRVLHGTIGPGGWRIGFLVGLLVPGLILGSGHPVYISGPLSLVGAGLLVGYGTRTGSGCTSGHGVCGAANLSPRSAIATLIFIGVAMVTVYAVKLLDLP